MVNMVPQTAGAIDIVETFPRSIRVIEDLRIPVADGVELSARVWLPIDADQDPVPAIVEYVPFRHRDFTAPRDAALHPWFAGHGYASIRLELRGSGDSSGIPMDEYVKQEQDDGLAALEWIAEQPWCSGNTGMIGISWGGFSGLQIAARRPDSLKAIITVDSTDDRFNDDIHYMGGCLLYANLSWGTQLFTYMMRPPDPALSGEGWRQKWLERLEHAPFVLEDWTSHQSNDAYWQHASVGQRFEDIECAVYAVCGWADSYSNATMRMAEGLKCPTRILVGPWGHTYPHIAVPGPRIGFLQDATRWWDRWLKGEDNGIDLEPKVNVWMQGSVPPAPEYAERPGRWITHRQWPGDHTVPRVLNLHVTRGLCQVGDDPSEDARVSICSPETTGMFGGEWLPHGIGPEMPLDQRLEDGGALVFDSETLAEDLIIHGAPVLTLTGSSDTPTGQLVVTLSDVRADGSTCRITYGLLNLLHRKSREHPEPLEPGEVFECTIRLNDVVQLVPAGHRLRLSIATQAWPLIWPAPDKMTFTLHTGSSSLSIPVYEGCLERNPEPHFEQPALPPPLDVTWLRPVHRERKIEHDVISGETRRRYRKDDGWYRIEEHGLEVDSTSTQDYWIQAINVDGGNSPVGGEFTTRLITRRGSWETCLECKISQTATREAFVIKGELLASENGQSVFTRQIDTKIDRVCT